MVAPDLFTIATRLLPACPSCGSALQWEAVTVDDGVKQRPGWQYARCERCGLYLEQDEREDVTP